MRQFYLGSFILIIVLILGTSLKANSDYDKLLNDAKKLMPYFAPLPKLAKNPKNSLSQNKIQLGKVLYMDPRLSKNHDISCNSCHLLDQFGVDNRPVSPGHQKQLGARNSPSVYNAALHFRQFWDGRAKNVEEQALGPILNPVEMAMPDEAYVLEVLRSMPEYRTMFQKAFPNEKQPLTYQNIGKAIGAFERTLMTPSRFDAFLRGDDSALSEKELNGLIKFSEYGCTTCHSGVAVGASTFQKLGLVKPYKTKDLGRYEVTKKDADKHFFKPPSLRNVTKTGPYFHDGSIKKLDKVIKLMGKHQLGLKIPKKDIQVIKAFLGSLEGEIPESALTSVDLPKSTAQTPKPDPT